LQEDTQDLLATVAAASTGQQQQQQEQQPAPELDQPNVQQQQQQQAAGTVPSSSVEQAVAWQDEEGDDETEAGLPDGIVLVRVHMLLLFSSLIVSIKLYTLSNKKYILNNKNWQALSSSSSSLQAYQPAVAWQEEDGDDETEAGLPDGLVLARVQSCYYRCLCQVPR
jgi:hypothetical protein